MKVERFDTPAGLTGEGHMQGGPKGGKDRPRGVFYPKQSTDDSSATKPAAPKAGDSR